LNKKQQLEELNELILELRTTKPIIIVEGKKDQKALKQLKINSITIKKPLYQLIEEITEKYTSCIILTDLDSKGKKLYGILKNNLEKYKIKVNNKFRIFLMKNTNLSQIEGLVTYMEHLKTPQYRK